MGTSARAVKRVVLFVVEGPTEETALGRVFEKLLQNERVKFDVVHGDLTVKEPGETKSPRDCVRDAVLREIGRDRGYRWTDLERIVQMKIRLAQKLRRAYQDDPQGFVRYLRSDSIAVEGDYAKTWRHLEEPVASLARGSNLHLVMDGE